MSGTYRKYHTDLKLTYVAGFLPEDLELFVPASTLASWKNQDFSRLLGLPDKDSYLEHVEVMKVLSQSKRLYATIRFLTRTRSLLLEIIKDHKIKLDSYKEKFIRIHERHLEFLSGKRLLRRLGVNRQKIAYWAREKKKCASSLIEICRRRHPGQLSEKEVQRIRKSMKDEKYASWPAVSVYHLMKREGKIRCCLSTFYQYVRRMGYSRKRKKKFQKKEGIRASGPGEIMHADVTLTRLLDHSKAYIYFVIDNFSRAILSFRVSLKLSGITCRENIEEAVSVHYDIMKSALLFTDGGSENNNGEIDSLLKEFSLEKVIAQKDVVFSNSLIEAVNRTLKDGYLKDKRFVSIGALLEFIREFVRDYNNRPHGSLHGLTPLEVLHGEIPDKDRFSYDVREASLERREENEKFDCESCSIG